MMKDIKVYKRGLSVLLVAIMLLGVVVPVGGAADWIHRDRGWENKDVIRYVSVGDSMTNGYGFSGYLQDEHDAHFNENGETGYDFFLGKGVYGEGSYALQFEDWLRETTGAEVEHTKLALSAQRAEEVLYYLGGSDQPPADGYLSKSWAYAWVNGDFVEGTSSGLESYYKYKYDTANPAGMAMIEAQEQQMRAYYQESLRNADVISLAFGNAAFNAFFMDRVLRVLGALGSTWVEDETEEGYAPQVSLDDALALVTSEADLLVVLQVYYTVKTELMRAVPDGFETYNLDGLCDLVSYITASFLVNYKGVVDWVAENNPDAEVILVGMINSNEGMTVSGIGDAPIDLGSLMDKVYDTLNVYIAGLPAAYQMSGNCADMEFYYVDQPENPEMVAALLADLAYADWNNIDCGVENCPDCKSEAGCPNGRLDGKTVRYKTVTVYNDLFLPLMGSKLGVDMTQAATKPLQTVLTESVGDAATILGNVDKVKAAMADGDSITELAEKLAGSDDPAAVQAFVPQVMGAVAFLALENAIVESLDNAELNVAALSTMSGTGLYMAFAGIQFDYAAQGATVADGVEYFTDYLTSDSMLPFIRLVALVMVGNGISSHSTPTTHDRVAKSMIEAYEKGFTCLDKTKKFFGDVFLGNYTRTDSSHYVAITGESFAYAELLAHELNLDPDTQFSHMTWDALDDAALARADLITVGYDEARISAFATGQLAAYVAEYMDVELRADLKAYLYRALGRILDNDAIAQFETAADERLDGILAEKLFADRVKQDMDWAALLGDEGDAFVRRQLANVRKSLISSGIPETYVHTVDVVELLVEADVGIKAGKLYEWLEEDAYFHVEIPVADALMYSLESYLYSLISLQKDYADLITHLRDVNPHATMILLGQFNSYAGVELSWGDKVISLDRLYGTVAMGLSLTPLMCALLNSNVTYVDIAATETIYTAAGGAYDRMDLLTDPALTYPSEAGHAYILQQIMEAMNVTCEHVYGDWTVTVEPTPEAEGTEARICSACGHTESRSVARLEPVTEPVTEPETEPETEPVTEPETEPVTEPETEPVTEPVTEPETEPVTEPETEPVTEPEPEPVTEPATEPETEPATEPVTEPETEPETEPVTEPATEAPGRQSGCHSAVGVSMALWIAVGAAAVALKKREE